jgi:excisionase family DNA binding protein
VDAVTEPLLTAREVAEMLAVSPETVLRRWRAGELPGFRLASNVLRFRESEVLAWLEGRRMNGPGAGGEVAPVPFQSPDPGRSLTVAPVPNREGEDDAC